MRPLSIVLIAVAISIGTTASGQSGAAIPVDDALADSIWYDADQGKVVPVEVDPEVDDSLNRDSRWLPKPEKVAVPKAPSPTTATGGGNGGLFGSGLTFGNLLGWLVLILMFATAISLVIYVMNKAEVDLAANRQSGRGSGANGETPDEQMLQRMKHLPAELRRTDVNLRSEAERLMNAKQFDQAVILLFGHQLLLLDRAGMMRLNRGKTNRKYVRETRAADVRSATHLQATVDAFERSYFGRHPLSASDFETLWRVNGELEQMIQTRQGMLV